MFPQPKNFPLNQIKEKNQQIQQQQSSRRLTSNQKLPQFMFYSQKELEKNQKSNYLETCKNRWCSKYAYDQKEDQKLCDECDYEAKMIAQNNDDEQSDDILSKRQQDEYENSSYESEKINDISQLKRRYQTKISFLSNKIKNQKSELDTKDQNFNLLLDENINLKFDLIDKEYEEKDKIMEIHQVRENFKHLEDYLKIKKQDLREQKRIFQQQSQQLKDIRLKINNSAPGLSGAQSSQINQFSDTEFFFQQNDDFTSENDKLRQRLQIQVDENAKLKLQNEQQKISFRKSAIQQSKIVQEGNRREEKYKIKLDNHVKKISHAQQKMGENDELVQKVNKAKEQKRRYKDKLTRNQNLMKKAVKIPYKNFQNQKKPFCFTEDTDYYAVKKSDQTCSKFKKGFCDVYDCKYSHNLQG